MGLHRTVDETVITGGEDIWLSAGVISGFSVKVDLNLYKNAYNLQ